MSNGIEEDQRRLWTIESGRCYWGSCVHAIARLPIPIVQDYEPRIDPAFRYVSLPDWAAELGVDRKLLVFDNVMLPDENAPEWQRCDWIANAFHMLSGTVERKYEETNGPALSYAFRLPEALAPLFEHAWVNRTFLFLRRWAAREAGLPEEALFGPLPKAEISLTHDVDAVRLTPEIRIKQTAFQLANAAGAIGKRRLSRSRARLGDALRYAFSPADFQTLGRVRDMERSAGLRSTLHFYGGPAGWRRGSPRRMLIDPAYDIETDAMRAELRALVDGGWTVGLHQSFDAWTDPEKMARERGRVEAALGARVEHCRQHWLHFSWERTWAAQARAGLKRDSTLGFNDRPGFRSGHALTIKPWDSATGRGLPIESVPMVFMDSHFYDYANGSVPDVAAAMAPWLEEIRAVGGEATVNWHTHTITDLYGWGPGFEALLELLS